MRVLFSLPVRRWPVLLLLILTCEALPAAADPRLPPGDSLSASPFEILIAPNPLQISRYANGPRLRVIARQTGLLIERLDIYSMAGEPIRSLHGRALELPNGPFVPAGTTRTADGWWDLRTAEGTMVASGSYWIRLTVIPIDADGVPAPATTLVRALVLVR
ncbi:MAG: hypothetical protein D6685_17085 [Bacteroidetes bacterium]|nr:hypothetical protein AWN76_001170 [Rhodothermaceae bacterium RA]RMH51842.1 MAG: hypothetical protein D6685_17085 [Bacteroidota bacterium]